MIKRIVIAGCRDYNNYAEAKRFCDIFYNENSFIIEKKLNFFGWINLFHIFKKRFDI